MLITVDKIEKHRNTHRSHNEFDGNLLLRHFPNDFISSCLFCITLRRTQMQVNKVTRLSPS